MQTSQWSKIQTLTQSVINSSITFSTVTYSSQMFRGHNQASIGWAIFSENQEFAAVYYTLPSYFSVFSAELFFIKLSLEMKILIIFDSMSGLQQPFKFFRQKTTPIVKEIITLPLLPSYSSNDITLAWVPTTQRGIPGNESANEAAASPSP